MISAVQFRAGEGSQKKVYLFLLQREGDRERHRVQRGVGKLDLFARLDDVRQGQVEVFAQRSFELLWRTHVPVNVMLRQEKQRREPHTVSP